MGFLSVFKKTVTIDVDGLPVDVDAAEFASDQEATIAAVRLRRSGLAMGADQHPQAPDYDDLIAVYGEGESL